MEDSAGQPDRSASPQSLLCSLLCKTAREAVSIADAMRALEPGRVTVRPAPRRSAQAGWLVEIATPALDATVGALAERQAVIAAAAERWPGAWFLGWQLRPGGEPTTSTAGASALPASPPRPTPEQPPAGRADGRLHGSRRRWPHSSQRDLVVASMLRRPETPVG
jgi:hypothetical protein